MEESRKGKCVIFSAPSGAGKTTLVHKLLKEREDLEFSVSACSRPKRANEVEGKDYYFLTPDEFREKVKKGEFVEWEEVYPDRYYGTLRTEVERIWRNGHHVVFDVDVVGGSNLKQQFGDRALGLFIKPPDLEELGERLRKRATDTQADLKERLQKAEEEMSYEKDFDKVIVNDDLDAAFHETLNEVKTFLEA